MRGKTKTTEGTLREVAGLRYVARPLGRTWGVYDRALGSWPQQRPGLGRIAQDVTKAQAEDEAVRLNNHEEN